MAKINAILRDEGNGESINLGEVNGFMLFKGLKTDKKPDGEYQKDAAGRISLIEQPEDEEEQVSPQAALATAGKGKGGSKKMVIGWNT